MPQVISSVVPLAAGWAAKQIFGGGNSNPTPNLSAANQRAMALWDTEYANWKNANLVASDAKAVADYRSKINAEGSSFLKNVRSRDLSMGLDPNRKSSAKDNQEASIAKSVATNIADFSGALDASRASRLASMAPNSSLLDMSSRNGAAIDQANLNAQAQQNSFFASLGSAIDWSKILKFPGGSGSATPGIPPSAPQLSGFDPTLRYRDIGGKSNNAFNFSAPVVSY